MLVAYHHRCRNRLSPNLIINENKIYLHSKKTNWTLFRDIVSNSLSLNVFLKSAIDTENAINVFTTTIQIAAFTSTLKSCLKTMTEAHNTEVVDKIKAKRKLRKTWQLTRDPLIKAALNKAAKELKKIMADVENNKISQYLKN